MKTLSHPGSACACAEKRKEIAVRVLARLLLVLYGLTLIVSNTLGFKERAGADWVLWATAGGVLAILGFAVSFKRPATGLFCGIVVAAGLGTWMFLRFLETRNPMPDGAVVALSLFMLIILFLGMVPRKKAA